MYTVKVTAAKLNELRMLADWQLRGMGFDPASVTMACEEADNPRHGYTAGWVPHDAFGGSDASDRLLEQPPG